MGQKLTAKQQRFCDEYLIDLNATQAAIRAGYSAKTAQAIGSENLTKPLLKQYIEARMAAKEEKLIAKQDEILKYLTSPEAFEYQVEEGTGDGWSEANILRKGPDERERLKAAELLGKRYGLYTESVVVAEAPKIIDDIPAGPPKGPDG